MSPNAKTPWGSLRVSLAAGEVERLRTWVGDRVSCAKSAILCHVSCVAITTCFVNYGTRIDCGSVFCCVLFVAMMQIHIAHYAQCGANFPGGGGRFFARWVGQTGVETTTARPTLWDTQGETCPCVTKQRMKILCLGQSTGRRTRSERVGIFTDSATSEFLTRVSNLT